MQESTQPAVVVVDVEALPGRPALSGPPARALLRDLLATAAMDAGLGWGTLRAEDRGDGVLLAPEPGVPVITLATGIIEALNSRLRDRPGARARISIDLGGVVREDDCWAGDAVATAFRLVDAPLLSSVLDAAERARVAVAVSDRFFWTNIQGRLEPDPSTYAEATIDDDDGHAPLTAWIHVPGYPGPPRVPSRPVAQRSEAAHPAGEDRDGAAITIGSVGQIGGSVVGRDQYNYYHR